MGLAPSEPRIPACGSPGSLSRDNPCGRGWLRGTAGLGPWRISQVALPVSVPSPKLQEPHSSNKVLPGPVPLLESFSPPTLGTSLPQTWYKPTNPLRPPAPSLKSGTNPHRPPAPSPNQVQIPAHPSLCSFPSVYGLQAPELPGKERREWPFTAFLLPAGLIKNCAAN